MVSTALAKAGALSLAMTFGFLGQAQAATLSFFRITSNNAENVASQVSVEVAAVGTTGVSFRFGNVGAVAAIITDVYFDDRDGLLDATAIGFTAEGPSVAFSQNASPADLPSGNNYDFATNPTGASADSDAPPSHNGVDNSGNEFLTMVFSLVSGKKFEDVLTSLRNGSAGTTATGDATGLRLGMHIQAIGVAGGSDSFINSKLPPGTVPPVPLPASLPLLAGALGLAGLMGRRKFRKV